MSTVGAPKMLDISFARRWLILALILLSKVPVFFQSHRENDEVIYALLARNVVENGQYTIPHDAPPSLLENPRYNRPLFYHPPLYVLLLAPLVWLGATDLGVVVSLAGHALCVAAVWIVVREWALAHEKTPSAAGACLLAVAFDPILSSISARLWMDNLLAGLVSLGIVLAFVAARKRSLALWCLCGVLGGMACLTKLSAVVVLWFPVLVLAVRSAPLREKAASFLAYALPVSLAVVAWTGYFHHVYGVFLPDWVAPGPADDNPFMRMIRSRPPYYYLIALMSFQPLLLLGFLAVLPKAVPWKKTGLAAIALIPLCFLPFISYLSARELGFMSRHLAISIPALYACLFLWLQGSESRPRGNPLFIQACLALGIAQGLLFQTVPCHGDIPAFLHELFAHGPVSGEW